MADIVAESITISEETLPTHARIERVIWNCGRFNSSAENIMNPSVEVMMRGCEPYLDWYGGQVEVDGRLYYYDTEWYANIVFDTLTDYQTDLDFLRTDLMTYFASEKGNIVFIK